MLTRLGYRVLRVDAELVRRNVAEAVARIVAVQRLCKHAARLTSARRHNAVRAGVRRSTNRALVANLIELPREFAFEARLSTLSKSV